MANYFYKGKEVRSRSDRDRDVKLSWAHTVTLKHTDINFRVTDSVSSVGAALPQYPSALENARILKLDIDLEKTQFTNIAMSVSLSEWYVMFQFRGHGSLSQLFKYAMKVTEHSCSHKDQYLLVYFVM